MNIAFFGDSLTAGIPGASYVERVRGALPQHTIFNYGKINDTPLSLYRRIRLRRLDRPVEMAFVFVGVNDLLIERSWFFSRLRRHWARSDERFREHYRMLLDQVCQFAAYTVCISPLFIGEDFENVWQQRLGGRAEIIRELAAAHPGAAYLDVRAQMGEALRGKPVVEGIPQSLTQSIWDGVFNRSDRAIHRIAARRGLHYTVDGVHLNTSGADVVAAACVQAVFHISS